MKKRTSNIELLRDKSMLIIQILVLFLIGTAFYLFSGQEWLVIEKDSQSYLYTTIHNVGVMPVYPSFLFIIKYIFGETLYLDAAVIIQSVIAIIFTMIFVIYLQYTFRLKFAETILLYIGAMLPFAIDIPRVCVTHQIITESLAFSFFYIYFIFLLQYILSGKRKWIFITTGLAAFMALIRSQLLFLIIVTAIFFVCTEFAKDKKKKSIKRWIKAGINLLFSMLVTYLLVLFVYQVRESYFAYMLPAIDRWNQRTIALETENEENEDVLAAKSEETKYHETMSQMTHLIIIRGFFEADEEDVVLFDTPEMQEIFKRVYDEVDREQYRYVYAKPGLYMWKYLVPDKIVNVAYESIRDYLNENPELHLNEEKIMRELGMKVLLKHFDRYLYHSIRLMIAGFISSVFFQIERVYWLCHLITLFLFGLAIFGVIYCIKYKGDKKTVIFAGATVGFIFMLVGIITLVFMVQQRYMVYAMGIFYCSLYLLMRESLFITAERFPNNRILAKAASLLRK